MSSPKDGSTSASSAGGSPSARVGGPQDLEAGRQPGLTQVRSVNQLMQEGLAGSKKHNRSRLALVEMEQGEVRPVDVNKMDAEEKRSLLAAVSRKQDKDVLQLERERLERVGIMHPRITVRYNNLTVSANIVVGYRNLPTLTSPLRVTKKTRTAIIDSASGILKPGRFTLLLGPPGSGKTTLLQTLAGYNRKDGSLKVKAKELTYNGHAFSEFVVERSSAYISQYDMHYGELTVRDTFDFSARCQSSGYKKAILEEVIAREQELGIEPDPTLDAFLKAIAFGKRGNLMVECVIQALGLDICADTLVGNAMLRGISGGQKKRVTAGEILVGPAKAVFADEISTGLDSSTTFTIMSTLKRFTHIMNATMLIGLLQPQPETYEVFDDVILLSAGKVVFHGPLDLVLPFFSDLGFFCPERRGVADFLQEITTPTDQQKFWKLELSKKPYRYVTAQTFQDAFVKMEHWQGMMKELEQPFDRSMDDPHSLAKTKYGAPYKELLRANFRRSLIMQAGSIFVMGVRLAQLAIMAFVVATLFLKTPRDTIADGQLYFGVIFFSVLFMLLGAIGEMHLLVERVSVMFRQRDSLLYPGWCFAIPAFVMRVPWAIVESTLWSCIVYFAVGFSVSTRFLMFWFQLFIVNLYSVSLFQTVAAITMDDILSISVGSFLLLLLINTTGFILNAGSIPKMWIGAFWANPYAWSTRAVSINELTSSQWMVPDTVNGGLLGPNVLQFRGFPTDYWWVWAAVGMILGCTVLNLCVFVAACTYLRAPVSRSPMTPEAMEELNMARSGSRISLDHKASGNSTLANGTASGKANSTANGIKADSTADGAAMVVDLEMQPSREFRRSLDRRSVERQSLSTAYSERTAIKFEPVWMTFRDMEYSVPVPKNADPSRMDVPKEGPHAGQLRLLYKVNGVFRPQVLCALMGASGAGKTTLMDVLAGRKTGGLITGDVRVNSFPKEQKTFAKVSGYVEQTDVHLPETTVEESIEFSARLRLSAAVDPATRHRFVEEIMEVVDLLGLRNAHVGKPGVSGLSVEQRKRLTLAVELASNPSLVFLDEPTSGLDARAANLVMGAIRDTVDTGRTCVCTIHQPSVDIFESFDEVLLLKPGGRTIYFGPLGDEAASLISYFSAIPGVNPIKPRYNAAAWMLEETTTAAEKQLGVDFSEIYRTSELASQMDAIIVQFETPKKGAKALTREDMALPGQLDQFWANLGRFWRAYYRNPAYNLSRFVTTILISLVVGSMFWNQGGPDNRTTVEGVLNIAGVIFVSTLFVGVGNCLTIQPMIYMQREVYYRERASGMLSVLPYALAQQLVEVPYLVAQTSVASVIMYWMIGFVANASSFFYFWFLFFLCLALFTLWGILGVAITPVLPLANLAVSFFFGFWNLLSGFLIQKPDIPGWWIWAYYLTPTNYQITSLVTSQLGNLNDEVIYNSFLGVNQTIPEFLDTQFGYTWSFLWPSIAIQLGFIVAISAGCIYASKAFNFQRR